MNFKEPGSLTCSEPDKPLKLRSDYCGKILSTLLVLLLSAGGRGGGLGSDLGHVLVRLLDLSIEEHTSNGDRGSDDRLGVHLLAEDDDRGGDDDDALQVISDGVSHGSN